MSTQRNLAKLLVLLVLAPSCEQHHDAVIDPTSMVTIADARSESQGFIELWAASLPNTNVSVDYARQYIEPMDADSIELTDFGGILYYQPVHLCHRCFHFTGAYLKTGEWYFIERAEKYAAKLLDLSVVADEARWVQHQYPFQVHGRPDVKLPPAWFSGMAQGEMLSVLVRLYEFTGKPEYLDAAREVFTSLIRLRNGSSSPWVARLDAADYYWLEEFPHDSRPGMTLNGYIAGLYGVYDFFRVSDDSTALLVWNAALTTLKHYIPDYRRPGRTSYYCLGHDHPASTGYHELHIGMMDHLLRLTGDSFFSDWAQIFRSDVPAPAPAEDVPLSCLCPVWLGTDPSCPSRN